MTFNLETSRKRLQAFEFRQLFTEELGWSHYSSSPRQVECDGQRFTLNSIAELSGVAVFEVTSSASGIPDAKIRKALQRQVAKEHREHLLIFLNHERTASDWFWVRRENNKEYPRDHFYFKGQTGDLILGKLREMVFDLTDFDEDGHVPIVEVARRLAGALDIERVTRKFYNEFKDIHVQFVEHIEGIDDERDRKWFASVILNRLMFIYFLQKKNFVDSNPDYLHDKFAESKQRGVDRFYAEFLQLLFFEGFAKREPSAKARKLLGGVPYLNGGLFLQHTLEQKYKISIRIPDVAFDNLFQLFGRYSWHLDDRPSGKDDEINPDVLGYIFEKYINQKQFGAYYTRPEITEYLCDHTVNEVVVRKLNERLRTNFASIDEILLRADDPSICRELLGPHGILTSLSLLDPACGSGAFLIAALKTLVNVYSALLGRVEFIKDEKLRAWLGELQKHGSVAYEIKKRIITDNLYGVDIMEEAVEICKLRLFLTLVASVEKVQQLEPLPNIDFNVMAGNSLIGLIKVLDPDLPSNFPPDEFRRVVKEKNTLIDKYRHAASNVSTEEVQVLKENIDHSIYSMRNKLDKTLLQVFAMLKIFYQQAVSEKKYEKNSLLIKHITDLKPFHWGFEFDQIMQQRGGFDAIITNPPWEIFKPNGREFFAEFSDEITIKKMTIQEFKKVQAKLLKKPEIHAAWLEYLSQFQHQSGYFRSAQQFANQIGKVDGKKVGSDINYYKLFLEQCYNLLAVDGYCGIVIPSGIYTDLGAKQLREMLFTQCRVTGLFCFENRKMIFEGVDSRFKFVVLTFAKGGSTTSFPAAFMRHDAAELARFPEQGAIEIDIPLARKLSPGSVSLMEFKTPLDIEIAKKIQHFPMLGDHIKDKWNLKLTAEFHMTNDSHLYKTSYSKSRIPLYEGKFIHQFTSSWDTSIKYWVEISEAKRSLKKDMHGYGFERYRFAHRSIARNTDTRTLIATIISQNIVCGHSLNLSKDYIELPELIFLTAIMNSFSFDYSLRIRVTANITIFYLNQIPVPRLTEADAEFAPIVERAARLICTTPEFDDLAKEVGLGSHKRGATDPAERARLRAELDALVAHLYGLTDEEFSHILSTFPLVADPVKIAAFNAFRNVKQGLIQ